MKDKVLFHVGTGAGFYSEANLMMQYMCYCYMHDLEFELYADDANFACGKGWNYFYESFCSENHSSLNRIANYRYKKWHPSIAGFPMPNLWIRRKLLPWMLKRQTGARYLTQDLFDEVISSEFLNSTIVWPEYGMNGTVKSEYGKIHTRALQYNETTLAEINQLIASLGLPEHYCSIQIRSGDKDTEIVDANNVDSFVQQMDAWGVQVSDLFVMADDYRDVERLQALRPQWHLYTLCGQEERGYYNYQFHKMPEEFKRRNLIKLFAMVELSIRSDVHCGQYCNAFLYIHSVRDQRPTHTFEGGKHLQHNLAKVLSTNIDGSHYRR